MRLGLLVLVIAAIVAIGAVLLGLRASTIRTELEAAAELIPQLKQEISSSDPESATATVSELRTHTSAAKAAAEDPLWTLSSELPVVGKNLSAVAEVARSADDVARLGLAPLVGVYESLNWDALLPNGSGTNLEPLEAAAPSINSSAYAVRASWERLKGIDTRGLLPEVSGPLSEATSELKQASEALDSAADAASIAPTMLAARESRSYLLMIQNNAEARASGGIPGALAILTVDHGKLSLGTQSSADSLGTVTPPLPVDAQQQQIYSARLGKYMQDVNLTPDFPTAATTARAMWEEKTGQSVDGVISIDPMVLSYILHATGPVSLEGPEFAGALAAGLPTELTGANVVPTLLSDVYAKIQPPALQDAYFAGVAKGVFNALSTGQGESKGLIRGITQGAEEGRVLVWSAHTTEQSVLGKYAIGGSISGPSVPPAHFGIYFNDGTGAKMDFWVKRTVQLIKECPRDGYQQTTVRVTSTNAAPADAATSLPAYVTGGGHFGIPPGSVQTNIAAYGPVQANLETATIDGQRTSFASHLHSNRPVGILAVKLAPGESKTVEFTFGKIVQHTEPDLFVTPTIEPVKEVRLSTVIASCS